MAGWEPDLIARSTDLDLLFGIVRTGRLDHRGVVFLNIRYYSAELHRLRLRDGDKLMVTVKVNPTNLDYLHVRDPRSQSWIRVDAVDRTYAAGLSLHRQELNAKTSRERRGHVDMDGLRAANVELARLIADSLPIAASIQSNNAIARALGVGTQNLFGSLDQDGRLGELTGPFVGKTLNPLTVATGPKPPAKEQSTPRPERRPVPTLRADRSLAKEKRDGEGPRHM